MVALAEKLAIPVATSLNGKDSIPGSTRFRSASWERIRARARTASSGRRTSCASSARNRGNDDAFLGGPEDRDPRHPDRTSRPRRWAQLPPQGIGVGDIKVTLARMLERADGQTAAKRKPWVEKSARSARVVFEVRSDARIRRRSHPAGAHVRRADEEPPDDAIGRSSTPARGHVDGRDVRSARAHPELHEERRASRLGVPGGTGAEMRSSGAAVVVFTGDAGLGTHRRNRNGGAVEDPTRSPS